MSANIKIGGNIVNNVNTIKVESADQLGQYVGFYNFTPVEETISPTTETQEVTPQEGEFLERVTVTPVTAEIDTNIIPSNIKQGVTILGVQGEYAQRNALPGLVSRTITSFSAQDLEGATSIEQRPFQYWSGLVSVEIPSSVEEIKSDAFYNCSGLSSVVIHEGLKTIGISAFVGCSSLRTLVLPNSLTEINQNGLASTGLRTLEIGTGIATIGAQAFRLASNLQSITIRAVNPPTLQNSSAFDYTSCTVYVPAGSVDAYKAAPNWSNIASRIQAIPS